MDKEQQIEGIRQVVGAKCDKHGIAKHCPERIAQGIYAAGYSKQSDVVKEFAKRIKDIIHRDENISNSADEYLCDEIDELAAEFGAEVEE